MAVFPAATVLRATGTIITANSLRNKVETVLRTIAPNCPRPERSSFRPSAAGILTEIARHIRKASLESIVR
jgi:hypothetical protein